MAELLTRVDVESSDVYVSETNSIFSFQHPMDYLQPFLNILEPIGATIHFEGERGSFSKERQREDNEEQVAHIAYKRLIAKAKLPEEFNIIAHTDSLFTDLWSEIGFVYALDTKSPEIRAYKGKRVSVCTNQCVFGADNVTSLNLVKSSTKSIYDSLQRYVDTAVEDRRQYIDIIERLDGNKLYDRGLKERVGHIMMECKKNPKLGTQCAVDMIGLILDPKSKYGLTDGSTSDWVLYNACTESLKKSNILDEAAKTLLLERVFINN